MYGCTHTLLHTHCLPLQAMGVANLLPDDVRLRHMLAPVRIVPAAEPAPARGLPLQSTDPPAGEEAPCTVPQVHLGMRSLLCVLHQDGPQWGAGAQPSPEARIPCPFQQHSGIVFYKQPFCISRLYFSEGPAVTTTDFTKKGMASFQI